MTVGQGVTSGYLTLEQCATIAREGLARLPVDGRRVLVLIPDGTRTMPMPLMFETLERELGPRVAALDYLVALGTHTPMSDAQLSALIGRPVDERPRRRAANFQSPLGRPGDVRRRSARFPRARSRELTRRPAREDVPVALNRLATEYDHVLICGPVFPHEVVGFLRRHEVSVPRHCRARRSFTSRTGSAR